MSILLFLTIIDVPDPPVGKPHFYDISRESVSLSWCGPAYDGGSQVTHYAIEVQEVGEGSWSTLTSDCRVSRKQESERSI